MCLCIKQQPNRWEMLPKIENYISLKAILFYFRFVVIVSGKSKRKFFNNSSAFSFTFHSRNGSMLVWMSYASKLAAMKEHEKTMQWKNWKKRRFFFVINIQSKFEYRFLVNMKTQIFEKLAARIIFLNITKKNFLSSECKKI